jgi:hypothetical protein
LSGTVVSIRSEHLDQMSIGEFARRSRLSAKARHASLRALAEYVIDELSGRSHAMWEVSTREMPERSLLCLKRNVEGVDAARAFFSIFWGEVSEDSDGPIEWCRPVPADEAQALAAGCPELALRPSRPTWRRS